MEGYVKLKFFYWHEGYSEDRIESMWAIPVGENYKVENIPFYVQDFSLGDIVSAKEEDGELYVDSLVSRSGHSTIRVFFTDESIVQQVREELKSMGCDSEGSERANYVALDIPPDIDYENIIRPYLDKGFESDSWDYEEACLVRP
jgi:hypothetical protein